MKMPKCLLNYLIRQRMEKVMTHEDRAEIHFMNQLCSLHEELLDLDPTSEQSHILHKLKELTNHHSFNNMVKRRRDNG